MLSLMRHFKNNFWHPTQFSPRPRGDLALDPDAIRSWHQMRLSPDQDINILGLTRYSALGSLQKQNSQYSPLTGNLGKQLQYCSLRRHFL